MSATARAASVLAAALAATVTLASAAPAAARCIAVSGQYAEHDASGPACASPVGLCIAGDYRGDVRGPFAGAATSLVPTADTPATGVVLFTSTSTIDARIAGYSGTLAIRNAGAFRTVAEGSIVDVQTIVGGTGDFTGASA